MWVRDGDLLLLLSKVQLFQLRVLGYTLAELETNWGPYLRSSTSKGLPLDILFVLRLYHNFSRLVSRG